MSSRRSQVAFFAASVKAMYLASVEDKATVGCFLEHHLTAMTYKPPGLINKAESNHSYSRFSPSPSFPSSIFPRITSLFQASKI